MTIDKIMYCIIIPFLLIGLTKSYQVPDTVWGENCPPECECQITSTTQTLISKWKLENSSTKTALCVFRNESLSLILELPNDTESITVLQADDDNVMVFTNNILKHLQNVKSIDMQGSLTEAKIYITNDIFHDLKDLKYLSLQRVDLTSGEKAFSKLSSLEVLYVIHCEIGYLKWEMLDGLKNLKELYLVQSGIKELYGFAFYGTPELRRLFLSHNDLFSVEADAFVGLLKLEYLDLSNNRIDHLSGLTFPPLPHLQWLELKHNPIKVIFPHCFQYLNGTQHLTLGHQKQPVHLMKFSFRGLYSLLFLHIPNIDNDALFEHMFYDLKSLSHMNLRGRIKLINNRAFNGAHKVLKKLVLHDCQIERMFSDSLYGLESLHLLDLSENRLRSLPDGIFHPLKAIKQIRLNNNQITQIPSNVFLPLYTLQELAMYNNPWNCTCGMKYWKERIVMAKSEDNSEMYNETMSSNNNGTLEEIDIVPRCKDPILYEGRSVFQVLKLLKCDRQL
ncbi:insulin-like growth factor-binding protein complex acid labile subunit [Trichonephila clavata]|uniref:Insulin-like growth factor-binding protein complex acid labile subunit n=1 Tax=Trichonephila clavata TaxID=2740835 RepID=A0A8X6M2S3_TRICU|nr:insulin-like growth factor-binding protein complex acid labile subunit [Trichonephila clavata]